MEHAYVINVNGTKSYDRVHADDYTSTTKTIYKTKFVQLYNEGSCIDPVMLDPRYTAAEVQSKGLHAFICQHRVSSTDKNGKWRKSSFTDGPTGGQGYINKKIIGDRLLPMLVDPAVELMERVLNNESDLRVPVSSLVGSLDGLTDLDMVKLNAIEGDMWGHLEHSLRLKKFGHLSNEAIVTVMDVIFKKVISNTNVYMASQ
tara:strand:- start:42 stop:647 length:606 start_codon:yes stop_codon:yes gene_type:complete